MLSWKVLGNLCCWASSYRYLPLKDQLQIPYFSFIFFFSSVQHWLIFYNIFRYFSYICCRALWSRPISSKHTREQALSFLLYSHYKETHNSAFMYRKVLMRFNGILSSLYVHTGNQWQGCEFICWGTFTIPPHKIKTEHFMLLLVGDWCLLQQKVNK